MLTQAAMVATIISNQNSAVSSNAYLINRAPLMTQIPTILKDPGSAIKEDATSWTLVGSFQTEVSLTDSLSISSSPTSPAPPQPPEATHFDGPIDQGPTTQNEYDNPHTFNSPNSRYSSYTISSSSPRHRSYISNSPGSTTTPENHTHWQHLTSVAVSSSVPQRTLSGLQTTQTASSASTTQPGETTSLPPSNDSRPRRVVLGAVLGAFFGILLLSTVID